MTLSTTITTQSNTLNKERGKKRQDRCVIDVTEPYDVSFLISNMYQRTFDLPRKRHSFDILHTSSSTTFLSSSVAQSNERLESQQEQQQSPSNTQSDQSSATASTTSTTSKCARESTSTSLDDLLGRLEALDLDESTPRAIEPSPTYQLRNKIIDTSHLTFQAQNLLDDTGYFEEDFDTLYAKTIIPQPKGVEDLTDEENALVDSLLRRSQSGLVSQFKTAMVEFKDIYKLLPETWLNDEIINFYMVLLMDRAATSEPDTLPSIHCFNTFFCSTLRDQGYDKVKRWTKKVDIFSKRLLLIPINRSYHWTLGVLDMDKKQALVYDSLNGRHHGPTIEILLKYLELEHLDKKKAPYDTSDWQRLMPSSIPQQQNSSDCGVFACTFAERLARNRGFDFDQNDMVSIRRRMILDIKRKKIST